MSSISDKPVLLDGGEWTDHEDFLVGNEAGLRRLREACDVALQDGEYAKGDLGAWVGLRRLDTAWFDNPVDSTITKSSTATGYAVLLAILVTFLVGVVTVIRWLNDWLVTWISG